ncbi:TPA: phosphoenolpyruvate synthase [Candidatus Woesearchaeota archaeon]|nr:phosphoenolpyruvate synthase [Candidatus Woesearchaeota archaeon]
MKIASGIVTNKGGRTSHAAIVSRELGIPCVVGTEKATQLIKQGQKITISCIEGDEGHIYDGILKYSIKKHNLGDLPKTRTKIMLNLGNPDLAFATALLPNDGVGLAREEFIMSGYIQVHPLALLNYDKIKHNHEHHELIQKIDRLTESYHDKKQFFVDKLAEGIARIAGAFYPKPVILRFSDFKSNEYANLLGGQLYEPKEANPMIGWRGASRYYHPAYTEAFALECKAIRKVREMMGLVNLEVMIPMCRTLDEARNVLAVMKKYGLERGKNGLKVICMCEVPANVLLANEFLDLFDGFSIGSNDLTQFTLAVDRDSTLVAPIFDERNPAVLHLMEHVITIAKQRKKYIGICGQGPSDHPDLAQFLVKCGIESVSLNPDTVIKTRMLIAKAEKS